MRKLRQDGSKYTVNSNSGLPPAHCPAEKAPFIDMKIIYPIVRISRHLAGAELCTPNKYKASNKKTPFDSKRYLENCISG